ncbi:MAG: hypothetical protein WA099_10400 [Sulfuricurvum sp.]
MQKARDEFELRKHMKNLHEEHQEKPTFEDELKTYRKDVVFEHDYYILRNTKNAKEQKIYLPPKVKEALLEFIPENGILFKSRVTGAKINTVHKQILKIREIAGNCFSMHYTRNLIVSAMAEKVLIRSIYQVLWVIMIQIQSSNIFLLITPLEAVWHLK